MEKTEKEKKLAELLLLHIKTKGNSIVRFFIIILISVFGLITKNLHAFDLYGATVNDRDVPSSYMRYGIYGYSPIIASVFYDSPAMKSGFRSGHIILSINGKKVKKASDIATFTTDILEVRVFDGIESKNLSINRLAIENEKAARLAAIEAEKATKLADAEAIKATRLAEAEKASRLAAAEAEKATRLAETEKAAEKKPKPSIVYDDAYLATHYGSQSKGTPARQLAGGDPNTVPTTNSALGSAQLANGINSRILELTKRVTATGTSEAEKQDRDYATRALHHLTRAQQSYNKQARPQEQEEEKHSGYSDESDHRVNHGAINPFTGEFLAPAGDGYVGTRDGTFYAPAGSHGVINTRTGEFSPLTK